MSRGFRFVANSDGSKTVVLESGKGIRNVKAAESVVTEWCFRCRKAIGTNSAFHEINGQRAHVTCTKEF